MKLETLKTKTAIELLQENGTRKKLVNAVKENLKYVKFASDGEKYVMVEANGYVGIAKCNSKDRFNFKIGFSIALIRAISDRYCFLAKYMVLDEQDLDYICKLKEQIKQRDEIIERLKVLIEIVSSPKKSEDENKSVTSEGFWVWGGRHPCDVVMPSMRFLPMAKEVALVVLMRNGTKEKLVEEIKKRLEKTTIEYACDDDYVVVKVDDYVGVAKRNSKDKFDFTIGFSIALVRAVRERWTDSYNSGTLGRNNV